MHKFTSNIPAIFNETCTMQDASAQNLDLSGNLDVSGNTTIGGTLSVIGNETVGGTLLVTEATTLSSLSVTGNETVGGTLSVTEATTLSTLSVSGNETVGGTLSVTEATTLSSLSVTGNETVGGTLSVTEATTLSSLSVTGNETVSGTLSVTEATTLSSLSVIGNETVGGTLGVTNTTTLTGNVGIGGASGSHNLLVTGSERITGNLDVSGDLNVTGNFNFNEIIQNITTVNNEVIISTQLDISNQGTGPALKVSQFGVGEDQDVALFNAGDEGDAFKIDYAGNSHFYKPVEMNQTFDTILIRRTDAVGGIINLRTLQVFVNGVNILPSSTNSTTSIGSGAIGNVIEFITWNNSVVSSSHTRASNIRLNNVAADFSVHSLEQSYISLYIPLTQSFSISDVQSFVLYNRASGNSERINGFQIELYNRSNGFTPGVNVLYTMPINTTAPVYRFDLPSISSYTGFSSVDSTDKIKTVTVSYSYFNTTLLKVDGNVEFGGGLSVSGATTLNSLNVNGNINLNTNTYFDTIVIRRLNEADTNYINLNELQVWVNGSNILFPNSASLTGYFAIWASKQIDRGSHNNSYPVSNIYNNIFEEIAGALSSEASANALIIKNIPLTSINEIQAIVLYNRTTGTDFTRAIGLFFELYNSTNDPDLTEVLAITNVITSSPLRYRYNFPSLSTYTGSFATANSTTNIVSDSIASTEEANVISFSTELTGDVVVAGVINQTGASWSLGGYNNGLHVSLPYLVNSNIPFSVKQTPEVNCIYNTVDHNIIIQKGGKYLVHYGALSHNNTTTIEIFLRKNGVNVYSAYNSASSNTYRMAQASILLDLDIGDIVSIYVGSGVMNSNQIYRYFNGYLIG